MGILSWIFGFIPGILWLAYVYKKDIYEPEPIGWVALLFVLGAIIVPPTAMIEGLIARSMGIQDTCSVVNAAKVSWLIAGFIEESAKLSVVLAVVYYRKVFDEPMDGIVYASAVALGFASAENIIYMKNYGDIVILFRAPLSTLGHMLFSSIWGYAIGNARFDREHRLALIGKGFVLSAFFHGLYDFLLFTKIFAACAVYLVIATLRKMLIRMMESAQKNSPFADKEPD